MMICGIFQTGSQRDTNHWNIQPKGKVQDMIELQKERIVIAIHVGKRIENIFKLPCVCCCNKGSGGEAVFLLHAWDRHGNYVEAREGDWICKLSDGRWIVLDDKKYKHVLGRSC